MNFIELLNTKPNRYFSFGNYFSSQEDTVSIYPDMTFVNHFLVVSGKKGSGVTHIICGLCNTYVYSKRNSIYITAQSLLYISSLLKTDNDYNLFFYHLSQQELIVIDNLQYFYKKSSKHTIFLLQIIHYTKLNKVPLVLGCSDDKKDITKSKTFIKGLKIKRIDLKEKSSYDIYVILNNLCSLEDQIPKALLYAISAYNGMVQEHINCLISIRFNPLLKIVSAKDLTAEDFDELFNLKSYFPTQQFRKCFPQMTFDFPYSDFY